MQRFPEKFRGLAAAISEANIDTDKILPGRYLKTVKRDGLGRVLFSSQRYHDDGRENPAFVLNRDPWRSAQILIGLDNFGCGSSREHAPWALRDFGIHVIIAPSFADIFRNNCYKNGLLPISLPRMIVDRLISLADDAATAMMTVDLANQVIEPGTGERLSFEIVPEKKAQLLLGLDDIDASERLLDQITGFESSIPYCLPLIPAMP